MTRSYERLCASRDARRGLILLLAGVVLLPSLALSVLSFRFIIRLAAAGRLNLLHDVDGRRWYLEQQMGQALPLQALRFQDPDLWEQHDRTYGVADGLAAAAGGYTLQLAVPWTHLGVRLAPGQTIQQEPRFSASPLQTGDTG